jgi:hypothetical protein
MYWISLSLFAVVVTLSVIGVLLDRFNRRMIIEDKDLIDAPEMSDYVESMISSGKFPKTTKILFDDITSDNAVTGTLNNKPAFRLPKGKMSRRVFLHEMGHGHVGAKRVKQGKEFALWELNSFKSYLARPIGLLFMEELRAWKEGGVSMKDRMVRIQLIYSGLLSVNAIFEILTILVFSSAIIKSIIF